MEETLDLSFDIKSDDGENNTPSFGYIAYRCSICAPYVVRIRAAIETIAADIIQTVWNELDYRVDVCRITKGAHISYVTKTWSVAY